MKYTSAFDIIGPVMIGPSSSHTAGAVRIGNIARQVLQESPQSVEFRLMGSFAQTYQGHGTDVALLAGILGLSPSHRDVPNAKEIAANEGIQFSFRSVNLGYFHPNTVSIVAKGNQHVVNIIASSIGGGKVEVQELDGLPLKFTGDKPTLLLYHNDKKGFLAKVCNYLDTKGYNIARLQLERWHRGGSALAIAEIDGSIAGETISELRQIIPEITDFTVVNTEILSTKKSYP